MSVWTSSFFVCIGFARHPGFSSAFIFMQSCFWSILDYRIVRLFL